MILTKFVERLVASDLLLGRLLKEPKSEGCVLLSSIAIFVETVLHIDTQLIKSIGLDLTGGHIVVLEGLRCIRLGISGGRSSLPAKRYRVCKACLVNGSKC